MSNRFEQVRMTPDGLTCWWLGTYDWGQLYFDEAAEETVRQALQTLCTKGGHKIKGAEFVRKTRTDGVLWRAGNTALKHYTSMFATDAVGATKANVTLHAGLLLTDAHLGDAPLRTPPYFALALPKQGWLGERFDAVAMGYIEGRHPTAQELKAGAEDRKALYDAAILACGGNPQNYNFDDKQCSNLILGHDGVIYKLDIDMALDADRS